ncbi:MAG: hypothetical protein ISP86_01490 [Shewanellaceae bacterium]|nr:hypothetical protein [Shewanellaceae bacterium]
MFWLMMVLVLSMFAGMMAVATASPEVQHKICRGASYTLSALVLATVSVTLYSLIQHQQLFTFTIIGFLVTSLLLAVKRFHQFLPLGIFMVSFSLIMHPWL